MGTRKNFFAIYRKFGHALSNRFANHDLEQGWANFFGRGPKKKEKTSGTFYKILVILSPIND
jgi:hypothetical protein